MCDNPSAALTYLYGSLTVVNRLLATLDAARERPSALDVGLIEDMVKFVRWSANVRDDTAEAVAVARALHKRIMASMLVDLEYAPGEFLRPEESLADFAKRLYDVGFRAALQQPARERPSALDVETDDDPAFMVLHNAGRHDISCRWNSPGAYDAETSPCTCGLADDLRAVAEYARLTEPDAGEGTER